MKKKIIIILIIYILGILTTLGVQKLQEAKLDHDYMYTIKIQKDYINVRPEIDLGSEILTQVLKDEEYEVVDYYEGNKYNWYKIRYDKRLTGWVACDKGGTWLVVE